MCVFEKRAPSVLAATTTPVASPSSAWHAHTESESHNSSRSLCDRFSYATAAYTAAASVTAAGAAAAASSFSNKHLNIPAAWCPNPCCKAQQHGEPGPRVFGPPRSSHTRESGARAQYLWSNRSVSHHHSSLTAQSFRSTPTHVHHTETLLPVQSTDADSEHLCAACTAESCFWSVRTAQCTKHV